MILFFSRTSDIGSDERYSACAHGAAEEARRLLAEFIGRLGGVEQRLAALCTQRLNIGVPR